MQVRRLVPIVVLVAICMHSGEALKARVAGLGDAKSKVVVKQRMNTVIDMLTLEESAGGDLPVTQDEFLQFCRKHVRTRGGGAKEDPAKDPWGTILHYNQGAGHFSVISAGPDLNFGTTDDIRTTGTIGDY